MMTPRQSLEAIASLIRQAQAAEDPRDARAILEGAWVHAALQASNLRKAELRAMPAPVETVQ
jgi:hypothetical protein